MNLTKLFEMQKALDERIVREKGLDGQDLLPMKILALQVELGELANEYRAWKFWSNDREPRREVVAHCKDCGGSGLSDDDYCPFCAGYGDTLQYPLLEEYVDCLHFILSIGLELGIEDREFTPSLELNVMDAFLNTFFLFAIPGDYEHSRMRLYGDYGWAIEVFLGLGQMLGFTWEEIEQAYLAKNAVNHERQANGY